MDSKVYLSETEMEMASQLKYGNHIRTLTDDFSVIDRVMTKEDKENGR